MTTHKEALTLALEALKMVKANADDWQERTGKEIKGWMQPVNNSITAIKEALAQPEQEPVAWLSKGGKGIWFHKPDDESLGAIPLYTAPSRCPNCDSLERQNAELDLRLAEQDQAPFGFLTNKRQRFNFEPNATGLSNMPMTIDWKIPLYGSPQPQRKPLTDEMVLAGARVLAKRHADSCGLDFDDVWKYYADEHKDDAKVVIEAAHGIKE